MVKEARQIGHKREGRKKRTDIEKRRYKERKEGRSILYIFLFSSFTFIFFLFFFDFHFFRIRVVVLSCNIKLGLEYQAPLLFELEGRLETFMEPFFFSFDYSFNKFV